MKKTLSILLTGIMMTSLMAGCSGGTSSSSSTPAPSTSGSSSTSSSDLKANNAAINVVSREDGSGTRGAFVELFGILEKGADGSKKDMTTEEAVIAGKTDVMLTNISSDQNAIGYISLGSLNDTVKALKIDGVEATTANVKSGTYKVSRPFNIATKGTPNEVTQDFINYILSAEGQAVVAKSYITVDDKAPAYEGKNKPSGKIAIAGSSSVSPIMEKLKEAYEAINPNATIEIQTSDSTVGMTSAIDGICDIGMASRELKDSEKEKLTGTAIALDGIAVIVNPNNTVSEMTTEQVKNIFTGGIENWSDINK